MAIVGLIKRLSILFTRKGFRSELDEEMAFHREQAEKELLAGGMTAETAHYEVLRRFGNPTRLRERVHETVGFWFEHVWQDCRYAVRQLRRTPGFTAALVGTLTLGIGAITTIFTLIYGTLMRSLPYPDADRIVTIEDVRLHGQSAASLVSVPRVFDVQARAQSFESVGFFYFDQPTLIAGTELPVSLRAVSTNAGFWQVFGIQPLLGRIYFEKDDQPNMPQVAVLSYARWQQSFGGDPHVIGRQVTIEEKPTTIIGVMPLGFHMPNVDLWRPAQFTPAGWKWRGEGTRFANVFGRLKHGISMDAARTDLRRIGEQLRQEHSDTDGLWQFGSVTLRDDIYGELRPALVVLMVASGFLLLIACLNVANLLLTRATVRRREVALRRALGASDGRIQLQFFTESTLLALTGGSAGLGLTFVLIRTVAAKLPGPLGRPGIVAMNWPVVWFAFAVAVAAGIVFGLVPAFQERRSALHVSLKQGEPRLAGPAGGKTRNAFIALQVGLSLVLLVGATLLTQSLWNLTKSPLGFVPDHVLTFDIHLPWTTKETDVREFYTSMQRRIESLPGVSSVGQIDALPVSDWHMRSDFDADWLPRAAHGDTINAEDRHLAGDYLTAMRTPLLEGRSLTPADADGANHPVLVNRQLVRQYLPQGNPLGKHLIQGDVHFEIVGVIGDVRGTAGSISEGPGPEIYFPADGKYEVSNRSFAVRSQLSTEQLIPAIREQVRQLDPQRAVANVNTMNGLLDQAVAQPKLNTALIAAFSMIALLLACVGIYGVVAWSVAQRIQEIGVRMALGATRSQIRMLFMRRVTRVALIGVAAGTCAALVLTPFLRSQLYGVASFNPWLYAISILLLLVPVWTATMQPASRAASVNPVDALRAE